MPTLETYPQTGDELTCETFSEVENAPVVEAPVEEAPAPKKK